MKYYVYEHDAGLDRGIFYVGKGCNKRCYDKVGRNIKWQEVYKQYPDYKVRIVERFENEDAAYIFEKDLIAHYKQLGYNLVNMSAGGFGFDSSVNKGRIRSESHKNKNSESKKGNKYRLGKKHTEETKQKIRDKRALQVITSETLQKLRDNTAKKKGIKRDSSIGKKISESKTGFKHSEESKNTMRLAGNQFTEGHTPWNKGQINVYSEEHRSKISKAGKGRTPWNKGLIGLNFGENNNFYGKHHTIESKIKIRQTKLKNRFLKYGKQITIKQ